MTLPPLLINPVLQWAVEPAHVGSVQYVEAAFGAGTRLPDVGQVLTLPFMVAPSLVARVRFG